jgi:hypothetical protein
VVKGANFKNGVAPAVPGWENVRLLAPHAELRLLVCGQASLIDAHRLRSVLLNTPMSHKVHQPISSPSYAFWFVSGNARSQHAPIILYTCSNEEMCAVRSYLGEALRALLVLEVRQLALVGHHPCERVPAHLPTGATATRCSIRTASNAHATVVLGGPPLGEHTHSMPIAQDCQILTAPGLST